MCPACSQLEGLGQAEVLVVGDVAEEQVAYSHPSFCWMLAAIGEDGAMSLVSILIELLVEVLDVVPVGGEH